MMTNSEAVKAYWQEYLSTLDDKHLHHQAIYDAWGFGDSAEMADELGALVLAGIKQVTASAIWVYEDTDEPEPYPGQISIILNGAGEPMCIIQTTDLTVTPFNEVDEDFAASEGEGDKSLRYWREAHQAFFTRECESLPGRTFEETMPVLCERFKVIYK